MKKILLLLTILILSILFVSCNNNSTILSGEITVWVGNESVDFYQARLNEYVASHENHPKIVVKPSDAGSAASNYLLDVEAGADIFTIPNDNLNLLTSGSTKIAPILNTDLINQIEEDNTEEVLNMVRGELKNGNEYVDVYYGVPYILQNLILYYNKDYISTTQVKSFEGMIEAAKAVGSTTKAFTLSGTDAYANSFLILANSNGNFPIELYEDGDIKNCDITNDEAVSIMRRGRRLFKDPNGYLEVPDGSWSTSVQNHNVLSVIGGAWDYQSAVSAFGSSLGIATIPTFVVTTEDGASEDKVYHSGTFNDCKMFVQKINSPYAEYLQPIMQFLSSREVQEDSFDSCDNLPAYKNAKEEFIGMTGTSAKTQLALAQFDMQNYGKAQPFGTNRTMHEYFYTKNADQMILAFLLDKQNQYTTQDSAKNQLAKIQSIWTTGVIQ